MVWDIGPFEYGASPEPIPGPTAPPSTTPPPGIPPAGPGGSGDVANIAVRQSGGGVFILGRLFLDSGTEYEATRQVVAPDHVYEARVLEWGFVDRSIPVPSGLPQLGDCRIRLVDTDRKWRDLLFNQTPRRRLLDLRLVREGESESASNPFATFEIFNAEFPAGCIEIFGRDLNFAWIDRQIPGLINRANFPDLMEGVDEAFLPIIGGILDAPSNASPPNPQGVLTLPRMTLSRWGLAQHPIFYVELCSRITNEDVFQPVDPGDYVITETPQTIDGVDYTLSFIDFTVDQDPAMEVRLRIVEGFYTRGEFGGMPAVQNSPLSGLRNPIDFLINILYGLLKTETRIPRFNTASFTALRDKFNTSFVTSVSPPVGYTCDGAIVEPKTVREWLAEFLASFEMDMYVNRLGEIEVNATFEEDPDRPVFSDGPVFGAATDNSLIGINSVRQTLANPTCNRLYYNSTFNYATGQFLAAEVFNNEDDQTALGGATSPLIPFVEAQTVNFMFVREPAVAEDVARRRMEFLALGSYRIEFHLPLPEVFDDMELAKLAGVTHYGGLSEGGYNNAEFKTTQLTDELDRLVRTFRGILRVPIPMATTGDNPNCPGLTGLAILDFGDLEYFDDGVAQTSSAQILYDPDDYPGLTSIRMLGSITREDVTYETLPTISIVDSLGIVQWTVSGLSYTANADDPSLLQAFFDDTITLTGTSPYKLKWSKESSDGGGFQVVMPQVRVFFTASDQAKFQIPMLRGLFLDNVGLYQDDNAGAVTGVYARIDGQSFGAIVANAALAFSEVDYRELYIVASRFTGSGKVIVRDITASANIAETELTIAAGNSVSEVVYSIQVPESVFTSGNELAIWGQHTVAFDSMLLVSGDLNVKVGSPHTGFFTEADLCAETAEVYARASFVSCEDAYLNRAYKHIAADWPSSTVLYFDGSDNNTRVLTLLDTGTLGAPIIPATIIETLTFAAGATLTHERSASMALTDQHFYATGRDFSPSTTPSADDETFVIGAISGP